MNDIPQSPDQVVVQRRSELQDNDDHPLAERDIALVDLLDRLLAGGVVLSGDVTLSIAQVDLVHVSLRALITSVKARETTEWNPFSNDPP